MFVLVYRGLVQNRGYNIPDNFTNLHKHKYDNTPTVCTLLEEEEEEILLYDSCTALLAAQLSSASAAPCVRAMVHSMQYKCSKHTHNEHLRQSFGENRRECPMRGTTHEYGGKDW